MSIEKVKKVLEGKDEGLKGQEIADLAGIDKKEVDKIIKELKDKEEIYSPKRCFYALKK
jgi:predicted transcriptional regulator